jgi:putative FmdB family regulatory protein
MSRFKIWIMPTYSYKCADCGHVYDALQSIKAEPDVICPECQGRVDRLIKGGAGIVFKGSGFYVTDYKSSASTSGSSKGNQQEGTSTDGASSGNDSSKTSTSGNDSSVSSSASSSDVTTAGK